MGTSTAAEERVEMSEHNEWGWEEVNGIQEESTQRGCVQIPEQV